MFWVSLYELNWDADDEEKWESFVENSVDENYYSPDTSDFFICLFRLAITQKHYGGNFYDDTYGNVKQQRCSPFKKSTK